MGEEAFRSHERALGCANLLAATSGLAWLGIFIRAARHYSYVATFGYAGATGQWDVWVYLPLGLAVASLLLALAVSFLLRPAAPLLIIFSVASLAGVLPYLVATSGGV